MMHFLLSLTQEVPVALPGEQSTSVKVRNSHTHKTGLLVLISILSSLHLASFISFTIFFAKKPWIS